MGREAGEAFISMRGQCKKLKRIRASQNAADGAQGDGLYSCTIATCSRNHSHQKKKGARGRVPIVTRKRNPFSPLPSPLSCQRRTVAALPDSLVAEVGILAGLVGSPVEVVARRIPVVAGTGLVAEGIC